MDRDTAVSLIKQKCGFRTDKTNEVIAALQASQEILERGGVKTEAGFSTEVPWFLRKEDQTLTLAAAATEIALPDDFIREAEDEGPWYPDSTGTGRPPIYLEKAGSGIARRTFTGSTLGPQIYEVRVDTLFVYPAPEEALTLYWTYMGQDDVLSTNIENKWLKHCPSLLIGHAGQGMANDLRDFDAAKDFQRMKLEGQHQLMVANVGRNVTNRRTAIGRYK